MAGREEGPQPEHRLLAPHMGYESHGNSTIIASSLCPFLGSGATRVVVRRATPSEATLRSSSSSKPRLSCCQRDLKSTTVLIYQEGPASSGRPEVSQSAQRAQR